MGGTISGDFADKSIENSAHEMIVYTLRKFVRLTLSNVAYAVGSIFWNYSSTSDKIAESLTSESFFISICSVLFLIWTKVASRKGFFSEMN